MLFRRPRHDEIDSTDEAPVFGDFHEWVLSLPWVVERPYCLAVPGVRCFGVDCEPLGRRQLWLVTGLDKNGRGDRSDLNLIVPREAAEAIEAAGWGRSLAPMPAEHVMVAIEGSSSDHHRHVEALTLTAYGYAMS